MAKPNYQFEKRQREMEKKRKKEEKAQRKSSGTDSDPLAALPNPNCPICGGLNECEAAASGDVNTPCWCRAISLRPDVLERIPPESRGLACVCRQCAQESMAASPSAAAPSQAN